MERLLVIKDVINRVSTLGAGPTTQTYEIKTDFDFDENIKFLDSFANGGIVFEDPILSVFEKGDAIEVDLEDDVLDWYPKAETQFGNSGWLKRHIFRRKNANFISSNRKTILVISCHVLSN